MRVTSAIFLILIPACATEPGDSRLQSFSHEGYTVQVEAIRTDPQTAVYLDTARCAQLPGDPYAVTWYRLAQPIHFPDGKNWYGVYETDRTIYFYDSLAVRHETLHDLEWVNHREAGHPSPPFGVCDAGS